MEVKLFMVCVLPGNPIPYWKKTTAHLFYKFMIFFGVDLIYNHSDYRLMNKKALDSLSNFKEVNLFLRGIVPLIGLRYSIVEYARNKRFAGKSKYPLMKMIAFAWDGITSFSIKPIQNCLRIRIYTFCR